MDEILASLVDAFKIASPEEKEHYLRECVVTPARSVIREFVNVHLDFCGLLKDDSRTEKPIGNSRLNNGSDPNQNQDDSSGLISMLHRLVFIQCLQPTWQEHVQQLADKRDSDPKLGLGDLEFGPLAAAIAHGTVHSFHQNEYSWELLKSNCAQDETSVIDVKAIAAEKPLKAENRRAFTVRQLEEGPVFETNPPPFAVAVANWNDDQDETEAIPVLPPNGNVTHTPQYSKNWKRLRKKFLDELLDSPKRYDEGLVTDLIDHALSKALNAEIKDDEPIKNPVTYLRSAIKNLIRDENKKCNRHIPIDESPPIPSVDSSIDELKQEYWVKARDRVAQYDKKTVELLIAMMWDKFRPQQAAQKLHYRLGETKSAKSVSTETIEAFNRLVNDLTRYARPTNARVNR